MQPFTAASHHEVFLLLVQVAILLFSARALGEVAQRLGQPSVVGEILAGILLGPSLLSSFVPAAGAWLVPQTEVSGYLLEVVSMTGVMLLLLVTGLETDLSLIRRHARTATGASFGGIIVPFATGFALGWYLPAEFLADPEKRLVFSLFVATAMSISAIPVIAKVLMDLNLMRRDIGQTILAAGMTDDAIGWVLLSIVAGLAGGSAVTLAGVGLAFGRVALFMILTLTVGRWLVQRLARYVQDEVRAHDRLVTLVVVLTFAWGALTQGLGMEAVLGAFFVGLLFGNFVRLPPDVTDKIETMTLAVFAPVFFGVAGLKVNLQSLLEPRLLAVAAVVILVASFGKVVGTYVGARLVGRRDHWTALAMGAGMNARGAMEIIVATIGLSLGILTQDMFSVIVLMAMATSLMAPPALRWALARVVPEAQETERLEREELARDSVVAQIRRVLLPVRQRPLTPDSASGIDVHRIEAHIVGRLAASTPLGLTLMTVSDEAGRAAGSDFLDRLAPGFAVSDLSLKAVASRRPAETILAEAAKNYQLLVLGATESNETDEALFHPVVDHLVRHSPCPTLIVRPAGDRPWPPRRILVPTNGTPASRVAAEIAFLLATEPGEDVVVLTVASGAEVPAEAVPGAETRDGDRRSAIASLWARVRTARGAAKPADTPTELEGDDRESTARLQIAEALAERGRASGVRARAAVEVGVAETVIVQTARREGVDLIVMGTTEKPGTDRLFLGPRVERILRDAPCPVLVVNAE
ncbi:MAG TPA: cation:proton antiporter [Rubricoccaceae bacterium]|jgi:Kef-type K+ transport system membrane component KefB/nucleotide-binding universal stress UspA family protein